MEIFAPIAGLYFNPIAVVGMGVFAGMVAGMVGLGGGLILVPFMILFGVAPNVAAATANCFMVSTASSGLTAYWSNRWVDKKIGATLVCGSFLGGVLGVFLVKALLTSGKADAIIKTCFAAITGLIGLFMLRDVFLGARGRQGNREEREGRFGRVSPAVFFCGMVAGLTSSVLGIAGGVFIVPFLIYYMALATRTAVGTSLMNILFTAAAVSILHAFQNQNLDIVLAVFLMLGAGAGTQMGIRLSKRSSARIIKLVFALIALGGSARLWADSFLKATLHPGSVGECAEIWKEVGILIKTHSFVYGIFSVGLALGIGLFWGKIFKKIQ